MTKKIRKCTLIREIIKENHNMIVERQLDPKKISFFLKGCYF